MVDDAPSWADIHEQVCQIMHRADTVYIYNSIFYYRLLTQTATAHGLFMEYQVNTFCVMKWYSAIADYLFDDDRWRKLSSLAGMFGFEFDEGKAHRALYDCQMTRYIIPHLEQMQVRVDNRKKLRKHTDIL